MSGDKNSVKTLLILEKNWEEICGRPIVVYCALIFDNWQYRISSSYFLSITASTSQRVLALLKDFLIIWLNDSTLWVLCIPALNCNGK